MILQNGLMTGAQAQKLNSYPTLSGAAGQFLSGDGEWTSIADATTVTGGFMSADDKTFLTALLSGALANPVPNTVSGALEFVYSDTVLFSVPIAVAEDEPDESDSDSDG